MKNARIVSFRDRRPLHRLFACLAGEARPFLLESGRDVAGMGRYSFFGSDPFCVVTVRAGRCTVEQEGRLSCAPGTGLDVLRGLLRRWRLDTPAPPGRGPMAAPFLGGAVGFLAYDFGFSLESAVSRRHAPVSTTPELCFAFYDTVFIKDHRTGRLSAVSTGFPETRGHLRRLRARERLARFLKRCGSPDGPGSRPPGPGLQGRLCANFTPEGYRAAVRRAKEFIARGDIYQVNLAQRFHAAARFDPWALYRALSRRFPVSFGAYLRGQDYALLSASPERFLRCVGSRVTTRPMKGTRPRTPSARANRRLYRELVRDAKEKAELLMIVDLERNDLGRVCDYASVRVDEMRTIERYAGVYQATAQVSGVLHRSRDRLDLLAACFPGGSVTGCPKIRAM
ncbi:MAG: anthranilate synthase component I family protein, partial [Deltaproteobacteria bacterium]